MAKSSSIWGIDIGQCALKAMRCTRQGDQVVVDAVDYIEYPKILSQPDEADPKQLVREALEQFLSRNEVKGDQVAISVPGQSGLARFFKPPPVDAKKIPDIVRFEARQQIPFPLEEVIWDYQLLAGQEVDGFAVDAEVGLFAMKRDQVFRALDPFNRAEIELDYVQLSPLAIYNFVTYDLLSEKAAVYDPDSPPPSVVVLALGTETTDLVVTNGFRVWQRSIPLGGNHFTKQLTKDLKLTFAKAEHLKRNARQAEDPKRVFQAMRPVFNDLVTEVQRSVSYFQNIDRKAKIEGVVVLGNAVKLPGLQQYLAKNLGYDVIHFDEFRRLDETAVKGSPAYKENQLAFGVCYGLCLQGLGVAKLNTNLIPRELLTERLIRAKKPWAVASVAALLLACSFNFFFNYSAWYRVHQSRSVGGVTWKQAESEVDAVSSTSNNYEKTDKDKLATKQLLERIGNEVVGNADRRILWLELLTSINMGLPRTPGVDPSVVPDPKTLPFTKRVELNIDTVETQYFSDLTEWYTDLAKKKYQDTQREIARLQAAAGMAPPPAPAGDSAAASGDAETGALSGEGWVVELTGYHFYSDGPQNYGPLHVYSTLINHLENGVVMLPNPKADGQLVAFAMDEMGVSHPMLVYEQYDPNFKIPNPNAAGAMPTAGMSGLSMAGGTGPMGGAGPMAGGAGPMAGGAGPMGGVGGVRPGSGRSTAASTAGANGEPEEPTHFTAPRYDFRVQFVWQPKPLSERLQAKAEAQRKLAEEQAALAEQAAAAAASGTAEAPGAEQPAGVPGAPAGPAAAGAAPAPGGLPGAAGAAAGAVPPAVQPAPAAGVPGAPAGAPAEIPGEIPGDIPGDIPEAAQPAPDVAPAGEAAPAAAPPATSEIPE